MKRIFQIFCTIALIIFQGCSSEFLEEVHPTRITSETFFENDAQAKEAVIALYNYMGDLYGTQGDKFLGTFDMLRGDNLILPKNFGDNALVTWLTLNYNAETNKVEDGWKFSYETVYRANWIIANVTDNPNISENAKTAVLAEAHFMRGFAYFNLTRLYQEVPLVLQPAEAGDYYPEKSSNEECWAQVISDFEASLSGLPDPTVNFVDGRANKGVAHAMMARAYLYQTRPGSDEHWAKVKEHAKAVEDLNTYALEPMEEFNDLFVYTKEDKWVENQEVIWATGFVYGPIYGGLPFFYDQQSNLGGWSVMPVGSRPLKLVNENGDPYLFGNGLDGRARYALAPEVSNIMIDYYALGDKRTEEFLFYPTYEDYDLENSEDFTSVYVKQVVNADSLYKKAIETNGASGEYIHFKKYAIKEFVGENIWDGGFNHPLMYPIIRYADVLLMRAEAEYHLGNEADARAYLKRITDRAGFAPDYTNAFGGQALIDEILQQRRVELVFEPVRVPDLIRLDMFKPPHVGTYPGSAAWEEKLKVIPIPRRELDVNPNLVQNDLWR